MARQIIWAILVFWIVPFACARAELIAVDTVVNDLVVIDPLTGVGTSIGDVNADGIAMRDDGSLFGFRSAVGGGELLTIDPATGTSNIIGRSNREIVQAIAFGPDRLLYGLDAALMELVTFDTSTGIATTIGNVGYAQPISMAFAYDGSLIATIFDFATDSSALIQIDARDGSSTMIGATGTGVTSIEFLNGTLYGFDSITNELVTIDTASAAVTSVGPTGFDALNGLTARPSFAVPEPSTIHLPLVPLLFAFVALRRRNLAR